MVIKLVKNDFIDSKKYFLPAIAVTVLAAVFVLFMGLSVTNGINNAPYNQEFEFNSFIQLMLILVVYGLLIASAVLSIRATIQILYSGIYKVNAYRVFTYPATSTELFISKVITTVIWTIISGLVTALAFWIAIRIGLGGIQDFNLAVQEMKNALSSVMFEGSSLVDFIVFLLAMAFSGILFTVQILFAGALANSSFIRSNRGVMAFVVYIVLTIIMNILNTLIFTPMMGNISILGQSLVPFSASQTMILILRDSLYIIGLGCLTVWLWNNKLEVLN